MAIAKLNELTLTLNQSEVDAIKFALRVTPIESFQSEGVGQLHKAGEEVIAALCEMSQ